jgi:hypothetical protein
MHSLEVSKHGRAVACGVAAAILLSLPLIKNIDFRVYWYGAKALTGGGVLYGAESGIGYPMHYRYPPVSYLVLWPLGLLPLGWAGAVWMAGAWATAAWAVRVALARMPWRMTGREAALAGGYMAVYVVLAVKAGNIQPYLIAMILAALALAERHRASAAALLAGAISFKIWPLYFLPWFAVRGRRGVLGWTALFLALLWLAPLARWTPGEYAALLGQWFRSEFGTATAASELWYYPGQSLRGMLLRYLSRPGEWAAGYPDVHLMELPPRVVVNVWTGLSAVLYAGLCVGVWRARARRRWLWDGMAFAGLTLLQPFAPKSSLISMGPAALAAAVAGSRDRRARWLFAAACALSVAGAVVQQRYAQRLGLVLGVDFAAAVLVAAALLRHDLHRGLPEGGARAGGVEDGELALVAAGGEGGEGDAEAQPLGL